MMRKLIPLTALAVCLSGGVALADHYRGGPRGPVAYEHHGGRDWRGGGTVYVRDHHDWRGGGRAYYRNAAPYYRGASYRHYDRRPIYVARPVIRERYFNYYRRPAVIVENYAAQPGYYWVAGRWDWSGYEWVWQPGHYEPDPNYSDPGYGDSGYVEPGYVEPGYDGNY